MYKLLFLTISLMLVGCASKPIEFTEIQLGYIKFSGSKVISEEVAGYSYKPVTYSFTELATSIDARVGNVFGMEYSANVLNGASSVIEHKIIFPEPGLTNPKTGITQKYTSTIKNALSKQDKNMFFYKFDEEWEMAKGQWIFQVIVDGDLSLQKTFTVN